jgi:hypothetical protein
MQFFQNDILTGKVYILISTEYNMSIYDKDMESGKK